MKMNGSAKKTRKVDSKDKWKGKRSLGKLTPKMNGSDKKKVRKLTPKVNCSEKNTQKS